MNKSFKQLLPPFVVACAALSAAAQEPNKPTPDWNVEDLRNFTRVVATIVEAHPTAHTTPEVLDAAIRGLVKEIDPEGGEYLSEDELKEMQSSADDSARGYIGAEIRPKYGEIVLVPTRGQQTEAAGGRTGDIIRAVDGKSIAGMSARSVARLVSGVPGTTVRLSVLRAGSGQPEELVIERKRSLIREAEFTRPAPDIGMIVVPSPHTESLERMAKKLSDELRKLPYKGLIVDLRGNPGGLVTSSVGVAAIFLPPGALVATTDGPTKNAKREFLAERASYLHNSSGTRDPLSNLPQEFKTLPLVVLVDEGTTAGGEIIAAALKDHKRATIVGRKTFGRGSIQSIIPLSTGKALKLTTAYWQSPGGHRIQGNGVEPDEIVPTKDSEQELKVAIAALRKTMTTSR